MLARRLRETNLARWKPELNGAKTVRDEDVLEHFLTSCIDTKRFEPIELALEWLEDADPRKREASLNAIRSRPESFQSLERRDFTAESHHALDEALASASSR
jgi:hypothetical protein